MTQQNMLSEVYSSLKPLFIVSHLTGVFIFRIDTKSSKIVTSIWNKIAVLTFYMIYIIGIYPYSKSELIQQLFFTNTSKASSFALIHLDHMMTVSSVFWIFLKREKFFKILLKLSEIDEHLMNLGVKIDYRDGKRKLNFALIFILFIQFFLTILSFLHQIFNHEKLEIFPVIYSFMVFINGVTMVTHFVVMMFNIASRFQNMNLCIKNSTENLLKIHSNIMECVENFNSVYGTLMMIFFGNLFIWCCISASLSIYVSKSDIQMTLGIFGSLIMACFALVLIIYAAEKILNARQKALKLLYIKLDAEPENAVEIFKIIMQIKHTSVGFSYVLDGKTLKISSMIPNNTDFVVDRNFVFESQGKNLEIGTVSNTYDTIDDIIERTTKKRLFILSSEAGAGKTVAFQQLTMRIKEKYPTKWVSYIDLKEHTMFYNASGDFEDLGGLLNNILGLSTKNEFEMKIFEELYRSGNVVLLWNGFDEISPTFNGFILDVLGNIHENSTNVQYVCTRPLYSGQLKFVSKYYPYQLIPFNNDEQIEFLTKFFQTQKVSSDKIEGYIKKVQSISERLKFNTPLMLKLIAEIHEYSDLFESENFYKIYEKFPQNLNYLAPKLRNLKPRFETFAIIIELLFSTKFELFSSKTYPIEI
ncbi:unnamed protein product [Chironomus riparius]|uniref:Gustatory receptor n=1 Tax=Chironomus riparius TaxID=315576 RepID=A0A9N9WZF9_9DIPT|nr:unnamed protein product [Chironomus riparius]